MTHHEVPLWTLSEGRNRGWANLHDMFPWPTEGGLDRVGPCNPNKCWRVLVNLPSVLEGRSFEVFHALYTLEPHADSVEVVSEVFTLNCAPTLDEALYSFRETVGEWLWSLHSLETELDRYDFLLYRAPKVLR